MLKKLLEYIRITPRTLVVILILLLLVDGAVRSYQTGLFREPGRVRLVNEELATLQTLSKEVKSAKGYKILFLGDSAVYGSAVKDSSQTIPAYLEQELNRQWPGRQVKVFNVSFKGFGMSENYFLLNSLADADLDLVVYNVSTGWFSRKKTLEHPNVMRLAEEYFGQAQVNQTGLKTRRSRKEQIADKVNRAVGTVWSLYQNRSSITVRLLGKPLRAKLTEWQLAVTNPAELARRQQEEAELFRPWGEKDWSATLGRLGYKIGWLNLQPDNPQVIFYRLILDLLAAKRLPALFYASPQNLPLLKKYHLFDQPRWAYSMQKLRSLTVRQGVYFADYTNLVADRCFSDTVHLNAEGNQLVARQLAKDIVKHPGVTGK